MGQEKQVWGSRLGLILAMAGNAIGLGNFLRFPVQAVQNGGGAFIIPYIVSFILLGIPMLLIEWSTGKFGGQFGHHSPPLIIQKIDNRPFWKYIGSMGLFSSIVISAYYCYIESWTLSYVVHSLIGSFDGMTEKEVSAFFNDYLNVHTSYSGIPYETVFCYLFCIGLNVWFLSKGLKKGIERVAKVCMPLLLAFGVFLVYKAFTLKAGEDGAFFDGTVGLNFMWTPQYDSLLNPKVWLAAAGQMFFTLSLGMGCIQSYASYMKKEEDVVLNSMTAGFFNEFTEIVIGSSIIIPISIGYLGIEHVLELAQNGGMGLAFRTMPYLFEQWGPILSALAGFAFFGLLFFASVTSILGLAMPVVGFFDRSYGWSQKKGAIIYGIITFLFGLPTVFFFFQGVFDQYDYWGGTISLFVFAMFEAILFSWVLGVEKGWKLIHYGADIVMPKIFKYILKYVTPTMFILIFLAALVKPKDDNWSLLSFKGWELDNSSIIAELTHKNIGPNKAWFSKRFYSEKIGSVEQIRDLGNGTTRVVIGNYDGFKVYEFSSDYEVCIEEGQLVILGDTIYKTKFWRANDVFYLDISRLMLLLLLLLICVMIFFAGRKEARENNVKECNDMW